MSYLSYAAKLGSKENPIRLGHYEAQDLQRLLERAEMEYSYSDAEDKGVVRAAAREAIFKKWPQLYDHCYISVHFNEKDKWREVSKRWWETMRKRDQEERDKKFGVG